MLITFCYKATDSIVIKEIEDIISIIQGLIYRKIILLDGAIILATLHFYASLFFAIFQELVRYFQKLRLYNKEKTKI